MKIIPHIGTILFAIIFAFLVVLPQFATAGGSKNHEESISYNGGLKYVMIEQSAMKVCRMISNTIIIYFISHKKEGGILDEELFYISREYEMLSDEKLSPNRAIMLYLKGISKKIYAVDFSDNKSENFIHSQYLLCMKKYSK